MRDPGSAGRLRPTDGRVGLFDDTCYYLPFAEEGEARVVADILNSPACRAFLGALMFPDSKRPLTVELLGRISLLGRRWTLWYGAASDQSEGHGQSVFAFRQR